MRPRLINSFALTALLLSGTLHAHARVANETLALPIDIPTGDYATATAYDFASVLAIATPPNETNQLFFAERTGRIRVVSDVKQNAIESEPFLDISSRVTTHSENGLLGLAFHPNYATNGFFFVFYTTTASGQATNRLSRFERSEQNPFQADPDSELILIDQADQASNHNGGDIHFGSDGYLYVALGDEGGANDSHGNAQLVDKDFFAGLLRIDVDRLPANLEPTRHPSIPLYDDQAAYRIPADNPLVERWQNDGASPDSRLRTEYYAIGLRNPWRFTIDPVTNEIWVADVGQNRWEEINIVEKGGNYGWPNREGMHDGPADRALPEGFSEPIDPIYEYGRSEGQSVTGGVVYRGSRFPELYGVYLFGDYASGRVWALFPNEADQPPTVEQIASVSSHATYGVDPVNGDVLISSLTGSVERLVPGEGSSGPDFPETLSATGAFSDLATLTPHPGIYSYQPNLAFWSDYAEKTRWVSVPRDQKIGYAKDTPWQFPTGSIWIKHFELERERGNPDSRRRIETRFLVKTDEGAYGLSYQWNEEQTEAALAPPEGVDIDFEISENGQTHSQTWTIPSRQDCLRCHTAAAGFALSFNTRQLNRVHNFGQTEANILQYFSDIGILDTKIDTPENLPRFYAPDDDSASLEQRARSYLAVNCVSCHQPNGGAPYTWDARPHLSIGETGLIDGIAAIDSGDPSKRLVIRGAPEESILLDRVAGRDGFPRMPPIATNELDVSGISLLTDWISLEAPSDISFEDWQSLHFDDPDAANAQAAADPDFDGNSNRLEFLNRTLPLDSSSAWHPSLTTDPGTITVQFPMAPDRDFTVETSRDLSTWSVWPVSNNPPQADNLETLETTLQGELPEDGSPLFLRVSVDEEASDQ